MIEQNPQRYSRTGDTVTISAGATVPPLVIRLSEELELLPLLAADGVIVRVGDKWLVSPATGRALTEARQKDPHYWYGVNDIIRLKSGLEAHIGKTVPVITVDIAGLESLANGQEYALRTAGVTEIDWPYDDEGPIPEGVLRQINWTLSADAPRPSDRWRLTSLGLTGDYSYETLQIAPPKAGGRPDPEAIGILVEKVAERLKLLRQDFNRIGDIYFDGVRPEGVGESDLFESQLGSTPPPAEPNPDRQRVRKETVLVDRGG